MNRFEEHTTKFVQTIGKKEGVVSPSIINSALFGYRSAENSECIFDGSVKQPLYRRLEAAGL